MLGLGWGCDDRLKLKRDEGSCLFWHLSCFPFLERQLEFQCRLHICPSPSPSQCLTTLNDTDRRLAANLRPSPILTDSLNNHKPSIFHLPQPGQNKSKQIPSHPK